MADDSNILDLALAYARYGLRVFPVHAADKSPMPGYGWYELASSQINHVVEDFDRAMQMWGDETSVAWALGRDGCLAIDVDVDGAHIPDWMPELVASAVINITKRGQHLIFKMPDDMPVGNGTSGFPTKGWGEVRGAGGYIIIAGPDRPGLDLAEMVKLAVFPRPDYLREYEGAVDAVSLDELRAFAAAHSTTSNANMLNGVRAAIEAWTPDREGDPQRGRHPFAVWAMCEVADESLAGFYAFKDGLRLVQDWWRSVTPPERHKREWYGICCWAVGRALAKASSPPTEAANEDESLVLAGDNSIDPSFQPIDLADVLSGRYIAPSPSILKRDDRQALLYRGQINGVHGDSGLGKGWVALFAAAEQLMAGNTVMMLDLEDVASSIIGRLRLLGVADQAIFERFIYIRPSASFDLLAVEHLVRLVHERHPSLIIVDSLGEAFGLEGIDENADAQVGPWLRRVPRRLADVTDGDWEGPAVLIVDHVTKLNDNPLHPSGSKRKRAAVGGAQYWLQAPDPLSADKGGRLRLICAKDRHGSYARNEHVADLVIRIDPASWTARLYSPLPVDDSVTARLTRAVNKAVSTLSEHGSPASRNALALMMGGRRQDSFEAIRLAIESGAMSENGSGKLELSTWQS